MSQPPGPDPPAPAKEDPSLTKRARRLLFGRARSPFDPGVFHSVSLAAFLAWVGLGADGLSSICYGPEEAFLALGQNRGLAVLLAAMTAFTVMVISASYAQIIEAFPSGGGAYVVASKLLGPAPCLVAGTALRMIAGVLFPDAGSIRMFGEPWSDTVRNRIAYLPEERGLYKKMRILDQVVFFGEIKGLTSAAATAAAETTLRRFELWDQRLRKIEELSKGNQQKVQLAGVLVADPDLLLLDEPLAGLDPVNMVLVREILQELKARGKTIVLSTHLMNEAEKTCDLVCLIHRGRVVLQGPVSAVRASRGENAVHLEFEGNGVKFGRLDGVEDAEVAGSTARLRIRAGTDTNRLLQELMRDVRVLRFEVASPTLEEVFVATVGEPAVQATA